MQGQLSLFESIPDSVVRHTPSSWKLSVDGASRGNPGPSGAGIYAQYNDETFLKQGFFLGTCTNNQAEYLALLLGICQIKESIKPDETLFIISDSELLVRQLSGAYAVKNSSLRDLHRQVVHYLHTINYRIAHVLRAENSIADALANEGIDKRIAIPDDLRKLYLFPAT